ncbi:hypothetical protein VTO58DRAFT_109467 [Aureobasidium pullulans]
MAWFRLSRRKRKTKTTTPQIPTYDIIGLRAQILANLRVCQPRLRGFTIGTAFNRTAQVWHGIISWDVDGSEVCKTPEFATMGLALELFQNYLLRPRRHHLNNVFLTRAFITHVSIT